MTGRMPKGEADRTAALQRVVAVARGDEPADLVVRGGKVVNVLTGETYAADVAIAAGRVVGIGDYAAREEFDARGLFVAPGFVDAHIHIESTMLVPREFARAVVPRGTTTVVADPHEIANVLGADGIAYMLAATEGLPLDVFLMLPSCVPPTSLETPAARLDAEDLEPWISHPRVLGLAEVMHYAGVVDGEAAVLEKLALASEKRVDGHAPGLRGRALNAYIAAGIWSDHECTAVAEAREKLRKGMYVFIREGSVAKNLDALLPLVSRQNASRFGIVSDDRHPTDLAAQGHMDSLLRRAVALGLSPVTALQLVTLNPAQYFGWRDRGAIAPGYRADLVVLEDLKDFRVRAVWKGGRLVARDGRLVADLPASPRPPREAMHIGWERIGALDVPAAEGDSGWVIGLVPDQLATRALVLPLRVHAGRALADPARDIGKVAVVERHRATGNVGVGFVRGFGFQAGALASTVAHDSHNVIVVGADDGDMWAAVRALERMGGGMVAVRNREAVASVALPVAGLMAEEPYEAVASAMERLLEAARALGCSMADPFMALSFLALPVIPELRITDRGLVDVTRLRHIPVVAGIRRARGART